MKILALCGGVGGAKLAHGLAMALAPHDLTVIINGGDDFEHFGLPIQPDFDTVLYTLAGIAHPGQGWGRDDETLGVMRELTRLGGDDWFTLGDKDIALHLLRLQLSRSGLRPTEVALELASRLGVAPRLLPMSDVPVRTIVHSDAGDLEFQDYFVRRRCAPSVSGFHFEGAAKATLTPEILAATAPGTVDAIVICPSNPFVSIGPILAVPGMTDRLRECGAPVVAVSPIVAGKAVKGPTAAMLSQLGYDVSAAAIAEIYGGLIDRIVVDPTDAADCPGAIPGPILMRSDNDRMALAKFVLSLAGALRTG